MMLWLPSNIKPQDVSSDCAVITDCRLQVGNKAAALLMERMGREVAKCS